jgi:ABC-type lipoprotein export system ATPase subunit
VKYYGGNRVTEWTWPRGSEWRKWDLHVHSPASHGFKGDYNQFVIQLGNADCDVIGINDYFSVAGYREIRRRLADPSGTDGNKAYRESLEKLREKTLIPVVECRMTNVLVNKKGSGQRINFHLIFDPAVDPENIETFLKSQQVKGSSIGNRYSDSQFLLDDVAVDFNGVLNDLRSDGSFRDRFLVWLPYDEYGGADGINPKTDKLFKENLIYNADILGSSNKKQADFFLWKDTTYTEEEYRGWFRSRKPCLKGSDSHNVNDELGKLKDHASQAVDKYCWIKADPTFGGLRQIINEPEDRVYIGKLPPKLEEVRANPTRYIDRLRVTRMADADTTDTWFDSDLPLNADMVAIIGNKGSGKSALADILAVSGNTHCDPTHFSFLNKTRFCERNGKLAKQFEARPVWIDGTESAVPLNARPDINGVERVRYIPQTYLEKVCTETEPGQQSEFQAELRKVIFSHISDADKLGKETLDELIQYKTEELKGQIENARREISCINIDLVRLEEKAGADYVTRLAALLRQKQQELKAHVENEPSEVEQPGEVSPEQKAAYDAIAADLAKERETLNGIEANTEKRQQQQKTLTEKIALARKVEGRIDNFESDFSRLKRETAPDLEKLGLSFETIIALTLNKATLSDARDKLVADKEKADTDLDAENTEGLPAQKTTCLERIKALQDKLDAPNKRFQEYNEALRAWQEKKQAIEGSADKPESLKWYEAQIDYVKTGLPADIEKLRKQRREIAAQIHKCVAAIRDVYKELFSAVQELITASVIIKEGFKLTFESSIVERTLQADLFDRYVSQGNAGSFYGKEKGAAVLEELCADFDVNEAADALALVEKLIQYLEFDMRTAQKTPTGIASQLRKNVEVKDLYDFLWSFGYLEPEYSLKLDGKDLSHLSPGERGTLLLVFYLLVDKSNKPIIVDQPEENLDSQTVYRLLIPVIKDVKKRRQIIMVTHSPNIAVVCDAEQIIHAHIDRSAGNAVIYTMGAIESPAINRYLVDVLEGTRPAFDNRDAKYYVQ